VVVRTDHLSYFAVGERSQTVSNSTGESTSSSGGGGGAVVVLPLILLAGLWSARRECVSGR
jgi:MYXO-CTERM domain-containing protein